MGEVVGGDGGAVWGEGGCEGGCAYWDGVVWVGDDEVFAEI